jgi:hypothetical protein
LTIVAGIDEAGYGPRLGPLVSSAFAYRIEGVSQGPGELWELLSDVVARPGRKVRNRLAVGDSKKLFSQASGIGKLERSLLALLAAAGTVGERPEDLTAALLSPRCRDSLAVHPWYASRGERLPLSTCGDETAGLAARLCCSCESKGVQLLKFISRLLAEGEYNRRVELLDNKATVLLGLVLELLRELRSLAGEESLVVYIDRLGGRTDYSGALGAAFPGCFLWEQERSVQRQAYTLEGLSGPTRIEFRTKADTDCFPVAVASMTSKYLRELFMRRFNAFWQEIDPQIPSTSGYHADAGTFLAAISEHRDQMGISEASLVRSR